jgi:hypothetical protein
MRIVAVALFVLLSIGETSAQGALYDLTVKVDNTKVSWSPWDGVPGLDATGFEPPDDVDDQSLTPVF